MAENSPQDVKEEMMGSSAENFYESTANQLVNRIDALVPAHPEILTMDDPWKLFKIGLKCDDLGPTYFQASWALAKVQALHATAPKQAR